MIPNDVKLIINVIDQLDTDFIMAKNKAIYSIANSIKILHIQKNMHLIYKQDFYKKKQEEINGILIENLVPIMDDLDNPAFIEGWKKS